MAKGLKFWRWSQFFHGQGHSFYESEKAKELYAKQLLSLSEKIFWLLLAPLLGYYLKPQEIDILMLGAGGTAILIVGLYFRHQGLRIIDELKTKRMKIEVINVNRLQPRRVGRAKAARRSRGPLCAGS